MSTMELQIKFIIDKEEMDWWLDNISNDYKPTYGYRRVVKRVCDIEEIIEIKDNEDECKIKLYNGRVFTVKGNFDRLAIEFNDLCNSDMEDGDYDDSIINPQ